MIRFGKPKGKRHFDVLPHPNEILVSIVFPGQGFDVKGTFENRKKRHAHQNSRQPKTWLLRLVKMTDVEDVVGTALREKYGETMRFPMLSRTLRLDPFFCCCENGNPELDKPRCCYPSRLPKALSIDENGHPGLDKHCCC